MEEDKKGGRFKASDYVELAARMTVTARYSGAADDLRLADEWEAQARTKQLPSTRTEIGAGGELIDRENRCDPIVDTVALQDTFGSPKHRLSQRAVMIGRGALGRAPLLPCPRSLAARASSGRGHRCSFHILTMSIFTLTGVAFTDSRIFTLSIFGSAIQAREYRASNIAIATRPC